MEAVLKTDFGSDWWSETVIEDNWKLDRRPGTQTEHLWRPAKLRLG